MARVIFSAEYQVKEEKLAEYLEKIKKLKELLANSSYQYMVFEDEKRKNYFEEVYIFNSGEDFDNFDDVPSEEVGNLVYEITTECIVDKKVVYKTLKEVE